MIIIKVLYDNGNNSLVKIHRIARKNKKHLSEMSTQEIMNTCFGLCRK